MKFTKMQGLGNDYVYVNCFEEKIENPPAVARYVSDRHFGIGSDGLIMINPSEVADFEMEMYNADGSRGEMCGNGIRCVAKYVYDYGLTDKTQSSVETLGGIKYLDLTVEDGKVVLVKVDLEKPYLKTEMIPNIYDNIKKAIHFLISTNIGEIVTIFFGLVLGIKSPLLAIQLLWINLVTDSFPAIALGLEKEEENIMSRLPRNPKKSLFSDGLWWKIMIEGAMLGMFTLLAFSIGNRLYSVEVGRTMAFLTLGILELVHSFNIKREESIFKIGIFENKYLVGALVLGVILQVVVVVVRPLAQVFSLVPLTKIQWLYTILIAVAPIPIVEIQKAVNGYKFGRVVYAKNN